jgi:hypothetical protein
MQNAVCWRTDSLHAYNRVPTALDADAKPCLKCYLLGYVLGEAMLKFDFSVKTRDGQKVESIQIQGKDVMDAERKLRQMYRDCEVMHCKAVSTDKVPFQSADIEEVLSLIAKHN